MQKDQDLADYLDMFLDNMKNRKIPQAAQARHLIPLLNVKATSAIAGLVAEASSIDSSIQASLGMPGDSLSVP